MADGSLSWLNLFVSDMQTGFGPFVPVRLAIAGWTPGLIGAALSASTAAGVLAQVPAGLLCDATPYKRSVAAVAILVTMAGLLLIALLPDVLPVLLVEAAQGAAGVTLTLAIAAITLTLSAHDDLGERLGHNVRFAAIGGAAGAALLGVIGSRVSHTAVFGLAAAFGLPALWALRRIHPDEIRRAPQRTAHHTAQPSHLRGPAHRWRDMVRDRRLGVLMGCVVLFQLGSAGLLPLFAGALARRDGVYVDLIVSGAVIVPQLVTGAISPWIGRLAQRIGRRPLLIAALAMPPLRAVAFALDPPRFLALAVQLLDGVTSAGIGVLVPLIVADLTHKGGRFNLVLGVVGIATGIGATLSTAGSGAVATRFGTPAAFLCLAAAGLAATLLAAMALPETKHLPMTSTTESTGATHAR